MFKLSHVCLLLLSSSLLLLLRSFSRLTEARESYPSSSSTLSTKWTNAVTAPTRYNFDDGSMVQLILLRSIPLSATTTSVLPSYACGFYCNGNCHTHLFAILIIDYHHATSLIPQVVWSANRNNPVTIGATIELTNEGDLTLKDPKGSVVWSTNTPGKSVVGLNLTDLGNLVLYDRNNVTVWQSFDHPTDSLVPGQMLKVGQKLTPSASNTNWTEDDTLSLSMTTEGLFAQMESNPPQIYHQYLFDSPNASHSVCVQYLNGGLTLLQSGRNNTIFSFQETVFAQYMKLGVDGHLKVYETDEGGTWSEVADLLMGYLNISKDCAYPTACGRYGICIDGQCHCPTYGTDAFYFKLLDDTNPHLGCSPNVSLSCEASQHQSFLELADISYFTFIVDQEGVDPKGCKKACAMNCSCKAAIHRYISNPSLGSCYLPSQIYSLKEASRRDGLFKVTTYIKVQSNRNQKSTRHLLILGSILGAVFALIVLILVIVFFLRKTDANDVEEDYFDQVPGMPTRFTYDYLKSITEDFSKRLGEGGFGSVYEGTLLDGTKVAVKRLNSFGKVKKSFVTEVEAIGCIHHFNLVRLVGFCAEKYHRLIVYEHMSNGSLDRWIFHGSNENVLDWKQRKKIIVDIAKGLNYLHEDCRHKIVHLDIKPQNILLDENFNAKVADFGLSKLIARDQTLVVTTVRGTPGYLAPEWRSAIITEKVDVYSFGIVVLEIICGRKIFDCSPDSEDKHLLSLFKRKAEEGRLLEIVDKYSEDMQLNGPEAVHMMRIAAWCLQSNFATRPSMSMVIKVLDGVIDVPENLHYDFTSWYMKETAADGPFAASTRLPPSVLSGPR